MTYITLPQGDSGMSESERERHNLCRADEIEKDETGPCTVVEFDGEGCPIPRHLDEEWEELEKQVAEGKLSEEEAFVRILRRAGYHI
jgi:hypothetical protein